MSEAGTRHHNPIENRNVPQKFITIGEIMLRLSPPNYAKIRMASAFEASYGGSEANIALSLANLGVDATFFSVVPDNSLGKCAGAFLVPARQNGQGRDPLAAF